MIMGVRCSSKTIPPIVKIQWNVVPFVIGEQYPPIGTPNLFGYMIDHSTLHLVRTKVPRGKLVH